MKMTESERMIEVDQKKVEIEEVVDQFWRRVGPIRFQDMLVELDVVRDTPFVIGDALVSIAQVTLL